MLYRRRIGLVDTSLGLQSGTWGVKVTEKKTVLYFPCKRLGFRVDDRGWMIMYPTGDLENNILD